jgi:hypothetical protein
VFAWKDFFQRMERSDAVGMRYAAGLFFDGKYGGLEHSPIWMM